LFWKAIAEVLFIVRPAFCLQSRLEENRELPRQSGLKSGVFAIIKG